jgi:hypothetical protein
MRVSAFELPAPLPLQEEIFFKEQAITTLGKTLRGLVALILDRVGRFKARRICPFLVITHF